MITNLDNIDNRSGAGGNSSALEQRIQAVENRVTSLSNVAAKTNLNNTFTASQNFNQGFNTSTASITLGNQIYAGTGAAVVSLTPEDATNKTLKFSGVSGKGRFDLNMNNMSKIMNLPTPTTDNEAATKAYVDTKAPGWTELQNWTGNFKTTSLEWTNTLQFGELEFNVIVSKDGVKYPLSFKVKTEAANNKFTSPLGLFQYGTSHNPQTTLSSVANGFFLHYNGTKINIIKVGNTQPEASTNVLIRYRKIG